MIRLREIHGDEELISEGSLCDKSAPKDGAGDDNKTTNHVLAAD
jgi:hypothetical protein